MSKRWSVLFRYFMVITQISINYIIINYIIFNEILYINYKIKICHLNKYKVTFNL